MVVVGVGAFVPFVFGSNTTVTLVVAVLVSFVTVRAIYFFVVRFSPIGEEDSFTFAFILCEDGNKFFFLVLLAV